MNPPVLLRSDVLSTRNLLALAFAMLVALFIAGLQRPIIARAGTAFTCTNDVWYSTYASPSTTLNTVNETVTPFTLSAVGTYTGNYNGIGYNPPRLVQPFCRMGRWLRSSQTKSIASMSLR